MARAKAQAAADNKRTAAERKRKEIAALEDSPHGSSTDIPSYEDMKNAILNAYPLKNIK